MKTVWFSHSQLREDDIWRRCIAHDLLEFTILGYIASSRKIEKLINIY